VLLQCILYLEKRLTHGNVGLGVGAASDHAAIVVAQHHNRRSCEIRAKYPFTAGIEAVTTNDPLMDRTLNHAL